MPATSPQNGAMKVRRQVQATEGGSHPAGSTPITIVLADDHKVVRSGLRMLLDSDGRFEVLAESGDVAGTIEAVERCRPQVLVLDLNMGGESSLGNSSWRETELAEKLVRQHSLDLAAFVSEHCDFLD